METISILGSIFTDFLALYGLLAIFVLMLLKELSVIITVPSD